MPNRSEFRFDFRGGVNTGYAEDTVDLREVVEAKNARLGHRWGSMTKRTGTQRIHENALDSGAQIVGLYYWDGPSGAQIVAIAGGNLYHKTLAAANFTEVSSTLSETNRPSFIRHLTSGTPTLYFAEGSLRKWTGSALSTPNPTGVPSALELAVYKTRVFALDDSDTLYWSDISDPETWDLPDGGLQPIETYDTEPNIALSLSGDSLLIIKKNSIARFQGVTDEDISVDTQTAGVSARIGAIAPRTVVRMDNTIFCLTDRGPYEINHSGIRPIGEPVHPEFISPTINTTYWENAIAVDNRARKEVWLFVPTADSDGEMDRCWVYNWFLGKWTGPWDFSFGVTSACRYQKADGSEGVLLGGDDGFVRDGDIETYGAMDDVKSDGTDGEPIQLRIVLPPLVMGDPTRIKQFDAVQQISADLGVNGRLEVALVGDDGHQTAEPITSKGAGIHQYPFIPSNYARRPVMTLEENTPEITMITGIQLEARIGRKIA